MSTLIVKLGNINLFYNNVILYVYIYIYLFVLLLMYYTRVTIRFG